MHSTLTRKSFTGLLAGLKPGEMQARGLLDIVPLSFVEEKKDRASYVAPLDNLKLVRVPTYGTLVLENTAQSGIVIAPMHIGFFQVGAQNHATSRVLILGPCETSTVKDCFCIQQSQGGLLKEAQQRFIILPLSLRKQALEMRGKEGFSRLWGEIDSYNRRYGIARGGHLERFLRPYFSRLLPFRHAFELVPEQVGAAYFVAGQLVGLEVTPNAAYWADVAPILTIYCYGAAALLAERHRLKTERKVVNLEGIATLEDLSQRLTETRQQESNERAAFVEQLATQKWQQRPEELIHELQILYLEFDEWVGQAVYAGSDLVYLSVFRDLTV